MQENKHPLILFRISNAVLKENEKKRKENLLNEE